MLRRGNNAPSPRLIMPQAQKGSTYPADPFAFLSGPNSPDRGRRASPLGIQADVDVYLPLHIAAIFGVILRYHFTYIGRLNHNSRRLITRASHGEEKEERLQSFKPINCFRAQPNVHLEAFWKVYLSCSSGQNAEIALFRCCSRCDALETNWIRETSNQVCVFTAVHNEREKDRVRWVVPQGWRMGEPLEKLREKIIKVDGIVDYEEW